MTYNYPRFKNSYYDLASFEGPGRGEQMPDLVLTDLDGTPVRLSDLWDRRLVIETGSVTCPMYAKGVSVMNRMAEQHPDTRFIVLYVREAHPGERIGPHETLDQKREMAGRLAEVHGDGRATLVDDIEGTAHKTLGSLPDMVYVLDPGGEVVFRGDWNDTDALAEVLDAAATDKQLGQEHFPPSKPSPPTAIKTLFVGGFKAVGDFVVSLPGLMALHRKADIADQERSSDDS
ncbi:MAG: hypothetical protein M3132_02945 [Actinomycetia bacterium]|nr:hypothetical protein [Actinomycetes bacterium]